MTTRLKARAVVVVTLEIPLDQPWGDDASISEIWTRASKEAIDLVTACITGGLGPRGMRQPFPRGTEIIGEVKVRSIITEGEQ